jgi:hypothetical protein
MPSQAPDQYDIIGDHRIDPFRFLVVDAEGQHYTWDLEREQVTPLALVNPEEWRLDVERDGAVARAPDEGR